MHLSRLRVRRFRNLADLDLDIPPQGLALVGENAQGKTNFLEAIYYLETFRSFRGARDDQLVAFGEDVFRAVAGLEDETTGGDREVAAGEQKQGRRKKVTVDGREPERLGDALGSLGAVVFSPDDVGLVSEGPAERRRFLDIVLSLNREGYLEALQRFRQVLSQRNAALREERPGALVRAFDDALVRAGARVTAERRRWIEEAGPVFSRHYATVSGGRSACLAYAPSVPLDDAPDQEAVASAYRSALEGSAERERRVGTTVKGPHRDEMTVSLEGSEGGVTVRDFGSGGQRRTAALALRLVEAWTIRRARGVRPLLLVDDVFAELDAGRGERVMELMEREESGQVILTAPKESDVRFRRDVLPRWSVRNGVVEPGR